MYSGRGAATQFQQPTGHPPDADRDPIQPDFLIVQPNGFADIVEFKLPQLGGSAVVGQSNRHTFSAEVNMYIAQTRVHMDYFDDPRNRAYFRDNHGITVKRPLRYLVAGRRWMFSSDEWRDIAAEYRGFILRTYDDLVDGVKAQFYS